MYLIDTNILLDYPQIIEAATERMAITTGVLNELDGLKKHISPSTSEAARRAAVYISKHLDNFEWIDTDCSNKKSVDEQLLEITEKNSDLVLLTNDIYLKVKAIIKNIPTEGYGNKDYYSGIKYYYIKTDSNRYDEELDKALTSGEPPENIGELFENQYVIFKDSNSEIKTQNDELDYETMAVFKYSCGRLEEVENKSIKNKFISYIKPRNDEQACLFDALSQETNSIVYAGGGYGRGKSFILNNFALQELEKGRIKKIVYIPNNSFTENTIDIGAMPGELLDKTLGQIGPLVDLVGLAEIQHMLSFEELEVVPMSFIRGRSFKDSIIIVNEAQNLTEDHVKLLIGRCGEGTRIMFDGDLKQTDSNIFKNKNGLKLLLNLRKSPKYSKIFSTVKLRTTERSQTASAAEFLDNF